jgi:hypothetical protein
LTDPRWQKPLEWSDVEKLVPHVVRGKVNNLDKWWEDPSEEAWKEVFPARTKQDLNIRRTRAYDFWFHAKRVGVTDGAKAIRLYGEWDYISALNVHWAWYIQGEEWWDRMSHAGAFSGGLIHYDAFSKAVHIIGKVNRTTFDSVLYVEGRGLAGYRNPPFPGFDKIAEARSLAEGGDEHFFPPGETFASLAVEALPLTTHPVEYIGFVDYVVDARWLTGGSSSVGRLEIELADGDKIEVKARKNFVLDTVDVEELAHDAMNSTRQRNVAIVKAELGKLRIAVSSDLYTYLQMSWVTYLTGHGYLEWPGNTLEEDSHETLMRMETMVLEGLKSVGLPYDYDGFDHQPTTEELLVIEKRIEDMAVANVPHHALPEFRQICANIQAGFRNSVLTVTDGAVKLDIRVTGGLMSGLRWTSLVGNGWNTVLTHGAKKLVHQIWPNLTLRSWLRGDDSAIFSQMYGRRFWRGASAMNEAYAAMGAKAGVGKFSLMDGMEFLRVWFGARCRGYPLRAIPGLVQRKPWTSEPWDPVGTIRALQSTCGTLRRRGCVRADSVYASLEAVWCMRHRVAKAVLRTPVHRGGFGIGEWNGLTRVKFRAPDKIPFRTIPKTRWRAQRLQKAAQSLGFILPDSVADKMAEGQLAGVVKADDIPSASRDMRDQWNEQMKKSPPRVLPMDVPVHVPRVVAVNLPDHVGLLPQYRADLLGESGTYGKWAHLQGVVEQVTSIVAEVGGSLSRWMAENQPKMYGDLIRLRRTGSMTGALNWMFGAVSWPNPGRLGEMVSTVTAMMVNRVTVNGWPVKYWEDQVARWGWSVAADVMVAPLVWRVASW